MINIKIFLKTEHQYFRKVGEKKMLKGRREERIRRRRRERKGMKKNRNHK